MAGLSIFNSGPVTGRKAVLVFVLRARRMLSLVALFSSATNLAVVSARAEPDTLVICPADFRTGLGEWDRYRRSQGHELLVVAPGATAAAVRGSIQRASQSRALKYVVFIGDEPIAKTSWSTKPVASIPTNYVTAKVNIRWAPEKEIASDVPYADIDGDGVSDLAMGRIPAHSSGEVAAVLHKVIQYEQSEHGPWEKCLNVVSGAGGFGAVTDAMLAAAGRQVITQTVPADYDVHHLCATTQANGLPEIDFGARARRELNNGGLAWIYLGHGLPTRLDDAITPNGKRPILAIEDAAELHCGPRKPLAVLIACYSGAMDAPRGCLGEELLLAGDGPVAVIAATRVTMPYGNTVIGYEMLRACFREEPATLGDMMLIAQRRTVGTPENDAFRASLDSMASALSPAPVDLAGERREHVLMYHLIGDPLARLHRQPAKIAERADRPILK